VPAALKLKEEYGDDLQVIFVESQATGYEPSIRFALKRGWLEHDVVWTSDYVFNTGSGGLPNFALLDGSGNLILKGFSTSYKSQIEDEIARMVKNSKGSPEGTPKSLGKAYKELNKGNFAKAQEAAAKVKAKPGSKDTDSVVAAAEATLAAVDTRFKGQVASCTWLLDNGYPVEAREMAKNLAKGAKGDEAMEASLTSLNERLASDSMKEDLSAAKDFAKLYDQLLKDGASAKMKKKFETFAADHSGSPVGKRAGKVVAWL
jgi:hypothetical protein